LFKWARQDSDIIPEVDLRPNDYESPTPDRQEIISFLRAAVDRGITAFIFLSSSSLLKNARTGK
jgi:hypothetical protein